MFARSWRSVASKPGKDHDDDERVSLAGLDPEEALRALLKVDPESEPVEQGATKDRPARREPED